MLDDGILYEMILRAGLVENQRQFGAWCGRSAGWYGCLASHGMNISVAALGILAANLLKRIGEQEPGEHKQQLTALWRVVVDEQRQRSEAQATEKVFAVPKRRKYRSRLLRV